MSAGIKWVKSANGSPYRGVPTSSKVAYKSADVVRSVDFDMPQVMMDGLADINEEFLPAILEVVVRTVLLLTVSDV